VGNLEKVVINTRSKKSEHWMFIRLNGEIKRERLELERVQKKLK
jgi:hypothetical protein